MSVAGSLDSLMSDKKESRSSIVKLVKVVVYRGVSKTRSFPIARLRLQSNSEVSGGDGSWPTCRFVYDSSWQTDGIGEDPCILCCRW